MYERGTLMGRQEHRRITILAIAGALVIAMLAIAGWSYTDGGTPSRWTGRCWNDSRYGASSTDNVMGELWPHAWHGTYLVQLGSETH